MEEPKGYKECRVILKDIRAKIIYRIVEDEKVKHNSDEDKQSDEQTESSNHKCKICDKKFGSRSNLLFHMKYVHPNELKGLLECQICHLKFIKKKVLKKHMKVKHFDGKIQLFECDFCGKLTKSKGEMKIHMSVHLPTVQCHICQAEFKQSTLGFHLKNTHVKDRKFPCKMCPKLFKDRDGLKAHEKCHNKKFQCTECIKTFATKSQLLKHQREYHENPGSYSCEICDKKCNQIGGLKRHQKTHDRYRQKPFKCQRCDFSTDERIKYENHMKFHQRQDEKFAAMKNPLKCSKCSTFCRDKIALRQHLNNVHPDELFQCDLCGKYLKIFSGLKKHIDLHKQKKNL